MHFDKYEYEGSMSYFPKWRLTNNSVVLPDERLPTAAAVPMGIQHLLAMSGSTIVAPLLMGFDPNVAVFFSGIGTLLFFLMTGGRFRAISALPLPSLRSLLL